MSGLCKYIVQFCHTTVYFGKCGDRKNCHFVDMRYHEFVLSINSPRLLFLPCLDMGVRISPQNSTPAGRPLERGTLRMTSRISSWGFQLCRQWKSGEGRTRRPFYGTNWPSLKAANDVHLHNAPQVSSWIAGLHILATPIPVQPVKSNVSGRPGMRRPPGPGFP